MYNPGIFRDWSERRFLLSWNIPGAAPQGLTSINTRKKRWRGAEIGERTVDK